MFCEKFENARRQNFWSLMTERKLPAPSRLEWDKLMETDGKVRSDLTAFQRFILEQEETMAESHGAGRKYEPRRGVHH
ncbi:hypothetical protein T10_8599 [Trichinella papuae]|nr:hypothetical protein T10_8599 [Trichinella papuae]